MPEAFEGHPDCSKNPNHQIDHVVGGGDRGLYDREFVAAQPCHKAPGTDAVGQAGGNRFEQLVPDQVAERVVDALEFIDVDVMHGELPAWRNVRQLPLQPFMKQRAVGQVRQRIIMGKVRDALLGTAAIGDVLVRCDPTAPQAVR